MDDDPKPIASPEAPKPSLSDPYVPLFQDVRQFIREGLVRTEGGRVTLIEIRDRYFLWSMKFFATPEYNEECFDRDIYQALAFTNALKKALLEEYQLMPKAGVNHVITYHGYTLLPLLGAASAADTAKEDYDEDQAPGRDPDEAWMASVVEADLSCSITMRDLLNRYLASRGKHRARHSQAIGAYLRRIVILMFPHVEVVLVDGDSAYAGLRFK